MPSADPAPPAREALAEVLAVNVASLRGSGLWTEEDKQTARHFADSALAALDAGSVPGYGPVVEGEFTAPTWDRYGVCICGLPLRPMSGWCGAGGDWQHIFCACGVGYVDEEDFFAIYDPADGNEGSPCAVCHNRPPAVEGQP